MSEADPRASDGPRRPWYRGIAAKLQIAFALIALLTVGATLVSLTRFGQIGEAMGRLTTISIPLVRLSSGLETIMSDVSAAAAHLARANYEEQRSPRMADLERRMGDLRAQLAWLEAVTADSPELAKLRDVVASLEREVEQSDKVVREKVESGARREKITEAIGAASEAVSRLLTPIAEAIIAEVSSALVDVESRAGERRANASEELSLLQAVYDMRVESDQLVALMYHASAIEFVESIGPLRERFEATRARFLRDLDLVERTERSQAARLAELRGAVEKLVSFGTGDGGLFALRDRELRSSAQARDQQRTVQTIATNLGEAVAALVTTAETEANSTARLTSEAIETTRIWLIVLAAVSLVLAGLIVWLFVTRYIVRRLVALAASMRAVAHGRLDAPIPAAGPDELGDMSRALAVFRDNAREIRSAREQAEKARLAAEEASRTKSSFLANMSHELRTPLNAIIGYSEILLEDAIDRGDDASQPDLQKIQAAGKHLLGLINDILDLSKIEAGRMDIYVEQVEIARLVAEVQSITEPLVRKNGNALAIDLPADIGTMRTDVTKLRQGLLNLLSNAAKFTKQGTIRLAVSRRLDADGVSRVAFAISDSGIGMTREQMGRLFQAFTQADSSTTRNFGGTGLGLTITRHFATMLGGSIDVDSMPGKGSIFTIVLPDGGSRPAEQRPLVAKTGAAPRTGPTVLVVDDDQTMHDLVAATLAKEGYRLLHARNGAEALRIARETPPDVITLDVVMPQVDGWSTLGMLKSDPALAHIPVIMLTIVDDRGLGFALGASEFMTKPIDRARLAGLVRGFAGQAGGGRVLVVDDDPDVRALVRATVESAGLKGAEAADGRAALDWLASHPRPSLILLDLMMPVMDGFEFLEKLRAGASAEVPVVVLTAKELTESERAFLAERTMRVVTKDPQSMSALGAALAAAARQPSGMAAE